MTPVNDDLAIRTALSDLTEGQPPMPPGRFQAVRQRAIRHRRRQLVGAMVTTAAAVGVVVGLIQLPNVLQAQPQARQVPGWALSWPDHRNGSVPQSVLNRAVLAWQYMGPNQPPDGGRGTVPAAGLSAKQVAKRAAYWPVVWYVGQTIDHGQDVVVMFEVAGPAGHELVVGQASSSQVMQDQPAWSDATSPWVLTAVPAPNPHRPPAAVGENVTGQPAQVPGQMPDNWMVVLTPPDVQRLTWLAKTTSGQRQPTVRTSHGLVVADTGQLIAPVQLTRELTGHGNVLSQPRAVGLPGRGPGEPQLAAPPALVAPGSFNFYMGGSGQGNSSDEDTTFQAGRSSQWAVLGVCYGPQPLTIQVNGHRIGTITCDSQQHELTVPAGVLRGRTLMLDMRTSDLTAWQTQLGSLR